MLFAKNKSNSPINSNNNLFKVVLLVVDGSKPSIAAANFAIKLAKQVNCKVLALNVVDIATIDYLLKMQILVAAERHEFEMELESSGKKHLEHIQTLARNNGLEFTTIQRKGSFHQTILAEAKEKQVNVLILGGWHHSVTRKDASSIERQLILDQANFPIIVIKE